MAWTEVGGQILTTEATLMEGKGKLTITGKLGDVMQESAQAAMSYVRSRAHQLGLPRDFYRNLDIHLHVPEGAIPKDGPSAGITIATSICSALTRIPVRGDLAMTGEITLRGKVLPIGGLKEKLLAAHRHGIHEAIMPKDNEKDLPDIPENIRKDDEAALRGVDGRSSEDRAGTGNRGAADAAGADGVEIVAQPAEENRRRIRAGDVSATPPGSGCSPGRLQYIDSRICNKCRQAGAVSRRRVCPEIAFLGEVTLENPV